MAHTVEGAVPRAVQWRHKISTVTLVRGDTTLVMKAVPAQVCSNCGEEYVADDVTARVLEAANAAAQTGVEVDVRRYVA